MIVGSEWWCDEGILQYYVTLKWRWIYVQYWTQPWSALIFSSLLSVEIKIDRVKKLCNPLHSLLTNFGVVSAFLSFSAIFGMVLPLNNYFITLFQSLLSAKISYSFTLSSAKITSYKKTWNFRPTKFTSKLLMLFIFCE